MAAKRYKSLTGTRYTFPVSVGGKVVWVSFGGPQNSFVASDEALQKAIESSKWFKDGKIGIGGAVKSTEAPKAPAPKKPTEDELGPNPPIDGGGDGDGTPNPDNQGAGHEPAVFPDVVDINGAVAVLKGEPYNIPHQSLRTPEKVMAHAAEQNVSFPNLK